MQNIVAPPGRGRNTLGLLALALVLILVVALGAAVAFRDNAATAVVRSVARGFGYDVGAASLDVNLSRVQAVDLRVRTLAGEPVLEARRLEVGYSLRDLLPGGKRLFGLESVAIDAPHVTVIHHPDGSYNVVAPPATGAPSRPNAAPLDVRVRLTGGSVDLIDRFVRAPQERRERLSDVHLEGIISPAAGSYYHAGASLDDGAGRFPLVGNARFDDPRGFELQHWTAARIPVAGLANFALSTHAIAVQAGELRNLDVTLGALATPAGTMQPHLGIRGGLANVRIAAAALAYPIRDGHGAFVVDGDGVTVRALDARINGIPLRVSGQLYDFAAPRIRFGLTARGDLSRARGLSAQSAKLPLSGAMALQGLAEGAAGQPLVFVRVQSPHLTYGTYRLDGARGFVALSGQELDVLAAAVRYGRIDVGGRASARLEQHTLTTAYATLSAPPDSLPYVEHLVPGMGLRGTVAIRGSDARLAARGYAGGVNGSDRLDLPFALAQSGSGTVGPVVLQRRDGASVYARAAIDRSANQTVALLDVHRLSLLPAPAVSLPGLVLPPVPSKIDAKLDATLTGIAAGTRLAAVSGALHAYGSWGDVRADADGSAGGIAARGRLTSSFERLAAFTGNLGARGGIDMPFALTAGASTVVQIQNARFRAANIRGIVLERADATLGLALPVVNVYSADVRIDGHDVTAAGRFGNGGRVHLTAGDFDLHQLRAAGVPVEGGRATVIADIGGSVAKPTANVVAAMSGAQYAHSDVGGDVGLAYDGDALRIDRATLTYGGAYAAATGAVAGLTLGHLAPRYDLHAQVSDADIATLARIVKNPLRYPAGTLDADVRVRGAGATPSVAGELRIPEGSLNGLSLRDARIEFSGNTAALTAQNGRVTVGTTKLAFGGGASRTRQSVRLESSALDLADFDDYFDEAEVLAGTGHAALAFEAAPRKLDASADLHLRGARYRRFELGSIDARVKTTGTRIGFSAAVNGANGRATADGSVNVPVGDPLRDIVRRSVLDLHTQIAGINLGSVLPAAGLSLPLLGTVDGSAVIRGRYPALSLTTHAALHDGVAGRVPIDRFTIAANAANGRGQLTDLTLQARGLAANVSGRFGLRPTDTFDLRLNASSPDINELIATASGKNPGVKGTFAARARLTGTVAQPRLGATIDANQLSYAAATIPAIHAEVAATRTSVDVRHGNVTLPRSGSIAFDGHAPLGGGADTPIALDFAPRHVDVNPYSSLLGPGSVFAGVFDGNVGVRGTVRMPKLNGELTFSNGAFHSNTLKSGLTDIGVDLVFAGTSVRIDKLHARAAPGTIDGSGRLAVRDLRDPVRGLTADVNVTLANAYLASPAYFSGTVDGTLSAKKLVGAPAVIGGDLTFTRARIPYTALLPSGGSSQSAAPALPDVAFDVGVNVARDVRVQSGPVDIGATGTARLAGTLAKPTLNGQFTATDGTVSLYRTFTVQNGSAVSFNPSDGVTPSVDATAVTNVPDPPTDVLLHITGPATQLHLAFSSEPAYSQQQILGLLVGAQALGAVSGVAQSSGSPNGVSVAGIGEGALNTQFTQKFLQPFTSKLGGALGLSDLNVNYNTGGGVSATARRRLGKNISFTYGEQIGGPNPRTSVGINVGNAIAGAQLTFYQATGTQEAFGGQALTPYTSGFLATSTPNYTLQAIEPPSGSGFVFSYQRHFW